MICRRFIKTTQTIPSVRYGCIWWSEIDPKKAEVALQQRYDKADRGQWGWNIVEFYLGKISEKR